MTFGEILSASRMALGMIREETAIVANVHYGTIGAWENGLWYPSLKEAMVLAKYFGFFLDHLDIPDTDTRAEVRRRQRREIKIKAKIEKLEAQIKVLK